MDGSTGIAVAERRDWMGLCAQAPQGQLIALLDRLGGRPDFAWLRRPELGSVMMRGRVGATGAAFNLGEMTVTRCVLRLADGTVGHGWVQGRDKAAAEAAAVVDALMQTAAAPRVGRLVLDPLAAQAKARRSERAAKAAATRVEFFTLARGEDL